MNQNHKPTLCTNKPPSDVTIAEMRTEWTERKQVEGRTILVFPLPHLGPNDSVSAAWIELDGADASTAAVAITMAKTKALVQRVARTLEDTVQVEVPRELIGCALGPVTIEFREGAQLVSARCGWEIYTAPWSVPSREFGAEGVIRHARDSLKMYICVDASLGMNKGKIAAQVGHVVSDVTETCLKKAPATWARYKITGETKVVLKIPDTATMKRILELPNAHGIVDAGRTQVQPGSLTAIAFPPTVDPPSELKDFKLL